jgi:heme-degrading monooxygenase HmoA
MHVQVVTYALEGIQEDEYLDISNELAPSFSNIPGLQAKIWLDDPDRGRYGAVYFWEDKESMERFLRSNLFEGTNPEFTHVESEGFAILENLTAQTQPVLDIVESRRRQPPPASGPIKQPGRPAPKQASGAKRSSSKTSTARKASSKA